MSTFVDETVIDVYSGGGGRGAVSFRREKYVPKGGPDGGDGGKGGDVVFIVRNNLKTLVHLKQKKVFKAKNGESGKGQRKHGKNGDDVTIAVAPGTLVRDFYTGELYRDFTDAEERWLFLEGGRGGRGNWHFRSSTRQTPRFAQPGEPAKHRKLIIELNLIADVGLVGLPNAGKSTLLSALTNARPEIASYPFTTKIPNLGVLNVFGREIVIADIPGIIKGASTGAGLGIRFLKHISRTFLIMLLVDLSDDNYMAAVDILRGELEQFAGDRLLSKSRMIVGTKCDIEGTDDRLSELKSAFPGMCVTGISAVTGMGLDTLKKDMLRCCHDDETDTAGR
ncbi:MAG: GTPase ObgE [Spirochaetales bacterium]|nr:GTPase ObgE [Spirochaetales bacterium]